MNTSARNNSNPNALQVKALYDYEPDTTFEGKFLSFKSGDIITVIEKCEGGWYKGILNSVEGLFPPTYCEELAAKRVMNVDTKKTSPTIKRMQTLLKLTVTGTGEQVEEVEQEAGDDGRFTRERAQSDARVFSHSGPGGRATSSGRPAFREVARKVMEGKLLLEGKLAGRGSTEDEERVENGVAPENLGTPEEQIYVIEPAPAPKEKPIENTELQQLKKRIGELESEKVAMLEEFKSGKEKLHDELFQKISFLNDMLDEKSLIIEIMKKDLEIKAEENKEITIELELEMERLRQNCIDLEQQVTQLTPLAISPRDTRAMPALPNIPNSPVRTKSSPSIRARQSPTPSSPSPIPTLSSPIPTESSPTPIEPPSDPELSLTSTPLQSSTLKRSSSVPLSVSQEISNNEITPLSATAPIPQTTNPAPSIATIDLPTVNQSLSASTAVPVHHHPPPPQRFNSLPSLSPLPRDLLGSTSPRLSSATLSPRLHSHRVPTSPRILYSSTLLENSPTKSKIPNFDLSLEKLAKLGAHPPPLENPNPTDPTLAAKEIADLKKRITELEEERLHMIEEYRTKKLIVDSTSPTTSAPTEAPTTSTHTTTSTQPALGTSTTVPRSSTPPPLPPVPSLLISSMSLTKSSSLPPVPLPPTSSTPLASSTPPAPFASPSLSQSPSKPPVQDAPSPNPTSSPSLLARTTQQSSGASSSSSVGGPSGPSPSGPSGHSGSSALNSSGTSPLRSDSRKKEDNSRKHGSKKDPAQTQTKKDLTSSSSPASPPASPRNLTWLQASVCVAVGSVAFYLVQSLVHRYYHL